MPSSPRIDAPRVHLLGHSLGGIVILRCLERHPQQPPGRVVIMGTPSMASQAAVALARFRVRARAAGRGRRQGIAGHASAQLAA